jgi:alkylation response protein AidB-like acyl-CoA dehydrogenase
MVSVTTSSGAAGASATIDRMREIADRWRAERRERFARRGLDPADFRELADAGYLELAVPVAQGGAWDGARVSLRTVSDALRLLAAGDPSPALVAAMHPAVLGFWLGSEDPRRAAWEEQRRAVFATALDGAHWGTVTSEPGSGGDVGRTRTTASSTDPDAVDAPVPGRRYRLSGDKHFGSGTGICSYMLTTAIPDGEDAPAAFFLDTRSLAGGGRLEGFEVMAEWDGVGMAATQSHAVRLDGCPAVRVAWDGELSELVRGAAAINLCLFTAVVVGVVDEAVAAARERLAPRSGSLRSYEEVEWSRACSDHWVAAQAYAGMLDAVESSDTDEAMRSCLLGKVGVAELCEQVLRRIGRVVGGGTFSRSSPFAAWFEDVRALGFLRPPWGLAYDSILALTLPQG